MCGRITILVSTLMLGCSEPSPSTRRNDPAGVTSTPTCYTLVHRAGPRAALAVLDLDDHGRVLIQTNDANMYVGVPGEFTLLPRPTGSSVTAYELPDPLNNRGEVIARSTTDWPRRSFIWRDGAPTEIRAPDGSETLAAAISDEGHVVGQWRLGARAFLYRGGTTIDLGEGSAIAINRSDQALIYQTLREGESRQPEAAWLWTDGTRIPIDAPAGRGLSVGRFPRSRHLNARGEVAGNLLVLESGGENYPLSAFIWRAGVALELPSLGGKYVLHHEDGDSVTISTADAINRRGDVVGASANASGELRAVLWRDGKLIDLQAPVGSFSRAIAVNDRGEILVSWTPPKQDPVRESRAFVWREGIVSDLVGSRGARSLRLNERGEVVGQLAANTLGWWRPECPPSADGGAGTHDAGPSTDAEPPPPAEEGESEE